MMFTKKLNAGVQYSNVDGNYLKKIMFSMPLMIET